MASKKLLGEGTGVSIILPVKRVDFDRLKAAGFEPIVRWVDCEAASDVPLKTVEALTLLDRREADLSETRARLKAK